MEKTSYIKQRGIMSKNLKEVIGAVIFGAVLLAMMFGAVLYGTSDSCWYAGMHDSECEYPMGEKECNCYNRFMKKGE